MFNKNKRNNYNNNGYNNGNFNNGNFNGNNKRKGGLFIWILIVGLLVGGAIWLKNEGYLGHVKNDISSTPEEQKATVNNGLGKLAQVNKNIANDELSKRGDEEAKSKIVNNKVLLKDMISYLPDMTNMSQPVYSVFVFSNDNTWDKKWLTEVENARKEKLKVYTYNGNESEKSENKDINGFVAKYFYNNYEVDKNDKDYGKPDGVPHPFMVLIVNGKPERVITKPSQAKDLIEMQKDLQKQADEKANNYKMPDNGVGIPYPDYKKYFKEIQNKAKEIGNTIQEKMDN